jgi:hypothetical protein
MAGLTKSIMDEKRSKSLPAKLSASEWRELFVKAACQVWYLQVKETSIRASFLHAGISNKLDGSENERTTVQLPGTGEQLFPPYGDGQVHTLPSQSGFGLQVIGTGAEVVGDMEKPVATAVVTNFAELKIERRSGDDKKVFLTEKDRKQKERQQDRKGDEPIEEEEEDEEDEEEEEEEDKDEEEDGKPLDLKSQAMITQLQNSIGNTNVRVAKQPSNLDKSLVGQYIAFHFHRNWCIGKIIKKIDPTKFKVSKFNYDIYYKSEQGSIRTCLDLEKYGPGDEDEEVPLSMWVLLEPIPLATKSKKRKSARISGK